MKRANLTLAMQGLVLIAVFWAVLIIAADLFGGTWPRTSERWQNFLTFGLMVSFLLLKSWLMIRRTWDWSRLGAALTATNLAFALLYCYVMAASLWRWVGAATWNLVLWRWDVSLMLVDPLRLTIILLVGWCVVELIVTPDPTPDDRDPWALLEEISAENERLRQRLALTEGTR